MENRHVGAVTEEEVFSSIPCRALQCRHLLSKGESLCQRDPENSVDGGRGLRAKRNMSSSTLRARAGRSVICCTASLARLCVYEARQRPEVEEGRIVEVEGVSACLCCLALCGRRRENGNGAEARR
jgi:hypothetical protein